ncbi:hypothetical protein GCM10017752_00580 [Streptomyces roseoviridis]
MPVRRGLPFRFLQHPELTARGTGPAEEPVPTGRSPRADPVPNRRVRPRPAITRAGDAPVPAACTRTEALRRPAAAAAPRAGGVPFGASVRLARREDHPIPKLPGPGSPGAALFPAVRRTHDRGGVREL